MASVLNDFQSRMAAGVDALTGRWSSAAVPANTRLRATKTVHAPFAYETKHLNGIPGWPQRGSS